MSDKKMNRITQLNSAIASRASQSARSQANAQTSAQANAQTSVQANAQTSAQANAQTSVQANAQTSVQANAHHGNRSGHAQKSVVKPLSEIRDLMTTDLEKRITHSVDFKLEVCFYLKNVPGATKSGAARFFGIQRKQVTYFQKREAHYEIIKNRRTRRNQMDPLKLIRRAKYFVQEQAVFEWFLLSRRDGKKLVFKILKKKLIFI